MDEAIHIKYCKSHYNELTIALLERQLQEHMSQDEEDLINKLESGKMDVLLEASNAITATALQMFGTDSVISFGGCPACTFQNVITHVADHLAVKYRRSS